MKRLRKVKRVSPDEATLRAWEDMRIEILHEIEDGGNVPEEWVNAAGDLAALVNPFVPGQTVRDGHISQPCQLTDPGGNLVWADVTWVIPD